MNAWCDNRMKQTMQLRWFMPSDITPVMHYRLVMTDVQPRLSPPYARVLDHPSSYFSGDSVHTMKDLVIRSHLCHMDDPALLLSFTFDNFSSPISHTARTSYFSENPFTLKIRHVAWESYLFLVGAWRLRALSSRDETIHDIGFTRTLLWRKEKMTGSG